MVDHKKQGRLNRASGKRFEKKVQADLENDGWIVMKFSKQIDLENNKLCDAKLKFNPFTHSVMYVGTGFPDFICLKIGKEANVGDIITSEHFTKTKFVECKSNGYLKPEEKLKCDWIKKNIGPVFIAKKGDKRGEIIYTEWQN